MNEPNITVDSTTLDDYGNLWVYPTGGGDPIKIGEKRPYLHQLFQPGVAVALTWKSYNDKPYVADAQLMTHALPPPVKPAPPPAVPSTAPKPPQPPTRVSEAESSKARGVAFSYVTALKVAQIRAGVLTEKELTLGDTLAMIERAELISNYIKGEFIVETK